MYGLYSVSEGPQGRRFQLVKPVSLFGCRVGYIPRFLRASLQAGYARPPAWHINTAEALAQEGKPGHALIINLKPKPKVAELSLYEVAEVWGYSNPQWTPIMMRLRGLFIDEDPRKYNVKDFLRAAGEIFDPIFSMMYLRGGIEDGQLKGLWTAPGPGSTNSVLLWPDALKYFVGEAKRAIPDLP